MAYFLVSEKSIKSIKTRFPSTKQLHEISGDDFVVPDLRKSGHASVKFYSRNEGIKKLQVVIKYICLFTKFIFYLTNTVNV